MAHKCLVGGTAYDITKGRTLIGGTGYDITKGKTLVGGTGYDINFIKATFDELMADTVVIKKGGRNSSSRGRYSVFYNLSLYETVYVLHFSGYGASISKVKRVATGSDASAIERTYLASCGSEYGYDIDNRGSSVYFKKSDSYGGTIAIVNFPSYPISLIDKVLSSVTLSQIAGRSSGPITVVVSASYTSTSRWLTAFNTDFGYSSPVGNVVFGTNATNPSLLTLTNNVGYINGGSGVYAASIVGVTE